MFRWASTEGGQQYNSDASTVKEAALRTSTGAAAPNQENSEYMTTLIPGPWDTDGTKAFKVAKLDGIHTRLLELAGFESENLTVFGDNLNDVKMFKTAARAVAVANATDEIKQYANHVIGSNEEDSVVKFILGESNLPLE